MTAVLLVALAPLAPTHGQAVPVEVGTEDESRDPPPPLPPETLADPTLIAEGKGIWDDQCTHCHGAKAYPGKAPKLQPRRYKPDFVWDRVHNGFRQMPPWKEIYSPEQIVAVVAYILSDEFWP